MEYVIGFSIGFVLFFIVSAISARALQMNKITKLEKELKRQQLENEALRFDRGMMIGEIVDINDKLRLIKADLSNLDKIIELLEKDGQIMKIQLKMIKLIGNYVFKTEGFEEETEDEA